MLKSSNAAFDYKKICKNLDFNLGDIDLNKKIYIPKKSSQLKILIQSIKSTHEALEKLYLSKFEFDDHFISFLDKEISVYCNNDNPKKINANIIVLGSLADLKCRILAAIAKSQNIPVISVWHGEQIGEKDEPQFGPIMQTYCDVILGYGDYGCKSIKKGVYNKGLLGTPEIIPSSSER